MLLVANWKMNGSLSLLSDMHQALLPIHTKAKIVICPPFVFLPKAKELFQHSEMGYGAQDVSHEKEGAFTGQISAAMLSQLACQYVIIGHSERRQYCGETDAVIALKCQQSFALGLIPILCVGENAQQKERDETKIVVLSQVKAVLDSLNAEQISQLVIAYEPVWAIGSGKAADPELANDVHGLIRQCVAEYDKDAAKTLSILYGGSVNAENIRAFLAETHINGALIGGASLKTDGFVKLILEASK